MQAVIMAGGKGTRLSAVTKGLIPKPMVPFCGMPLIGRLAEWLVRNGVREIVVCVGYLGDQIKAYFSGESFGAAMHYIEENEPLGTAGALAYAKEFIREDFALVYADLALDVDLERMAAFHRQKGAMATLFVHPNSHPYDSDLVRCGENSRVTGFRWKDARREEDDENLVNAGLAIFSPAVFRFRETVGLPNPAADTVAHHGVAHFGASGDPQPVEGQAVFPAVDHSIAPRGGFSPLIQAPEQMILFKRFGENHGGFPSGRGSKVRQ